MTATSRKTRTATSFATQQPGAADRPDQQVAQRAAGRLAGDAVAGDDRDGDRQEQRQHDAQGGGRVQRAVGQHGAEGTPAPRPVGARRARPAGTPRRPAAAGRAARRRPRCAAGAAACRPRPRSRRAPDRPVDAVAARPSHRRGRPPPGVRRSAPTSLTRTPRPTSARRGPRRVGTAPPAGRRRGWPPGRRAGRPRGRGRACAAACGRWARAGRPARPAARAGRGRGRRPGCTAARPRLSRWLDTNSVVPAAFMASSSSRTSWMPCGSRPFVGSSSTSSRGRSQQRGRQPEPLAHAERVRAHRPSPDAAEADLSSASSTRRRLVRPADHRVRPRRAARGSPGRTGARTPPAPSTSAPTSRQHPAQLAAAPARPSPRRSPRVAKTRPSSIRTVVVLPEPLGRGSRSGRPRARRGRCRRPPGPAEPLGQPVADDHACRPGQAGRGASRTAASIAVAVRVPASR